MSLYKGGRRLKKIIVHGQPARMLLRDGRQVWPCRAPWPIPTLECRMIDDSLGKWLEVGFRSPELLTGNASAGWTDARGYCQLDLQMSENLVLWELGKFADCSPTAIPVSGGGYDYWSRAAIPAFWQTTLVDLTATSDRSGKVITGVSVLGEAVALPNFPYAMPAQSATLQTDLRAAGFLGATVTSSSAPLTATARNHTVEAAYKLTVAHSGSSVSGVAFNGTGISLPSYPYALPGQRAALQAALRTAGQSGAVVKLHADHWTIVLPDIAATGPVREFSLTISPSDPYPAWDIFGNYLGLVPDDKVTGGGGNVRDPFGAPLLEALKQFARQRITRGARVLP